MTYEKFLELFENAAFYLKKTLPLQGKDAIVRKFFSNFTLQATGESKLQWYVSEYKISKPFAQFADSENVSNGREKHLLLELYKYITKDTEPWERFMSDYERTRPTKPKVIEGLVY